MFYEHLANRSNLIEIQGEYSIPLVTLSIIFACLASYTAISLNQRVKHNSFFHKNFWFVLASVAMGFGIWTMHYIGLFAFSLPVEAHYNVVVTIISIIPGMLASFFVFYMANRPKMSLSLNIVTSIIMGSGVSAMHYIGLSSIETIAVHSHKEVLYIFSICISFLGFFIFNMLQKYMERQSVRILTGLAMGLSVAGMYYISMFSMTFYVDKSTDILSKPLHLVNVNLLAFIVIVGIIVLLIILLLPSIMDKSIEFQSVNYDAVTKLPNHRLFEENLKNKEYLQIAGWHIHDFESINQEFGYQFSDQMLQHFAKILESNIPSEAELYRIERNRFAILSKKLEKQEPLQEIMEEIAEKFGYPLNRRYEQIVIPSVCAVASVVGYKHTRTMYLDALAVLNSPNISFNQEVIHYNPTIHKSDLEYNLVNDIIRALKEDELYLVYQPKVNGNTNNIEGLETLLRWNHPRYGSISPGVFIPILEKNERMIMVTDWVIERVCRQIAEWREKGTVAFQQVAINIPGNYVTSSHLLDVLNQTLANYNISPQEIELEITETSFVGNIQKAMQAVSTFREKGFSVALDDFGTGVSSLSYLKQMMISTLKIDKSFVDDIPGSVKDSSILRAIIALGESLELNIVFEGVETKEQVNFLTMICDHPIIQGYYFAKPMIADELMEWNERFQAETVRSY